MAQGSQDRFSNMPEEQRKFIQFLCIILGIAFPIVLIVFFTEFSNPSLLAWFLLTIALFFPIHSVMKREARLAAIASEVEERILPDDPKVEFEENYYSKAFLTYVLWLRRPRMYLTPRFFKLDATSEDRKTAAFIGSAIAAVLLALVISPASFKLWMFFIAAPFASWIVYRFTPRLIRQYLIHSVNQHNQKIEDSAEQERSDILWDADRSHEANIKTDHGEVVRGDGLFPYTEVHQSSRNDGNNSYPILNFVGLPLPVVKANQHIFYHGMTGSGKSQIIELLLESVLYQIEEGANVRVVIHDVGGEVLTKLRKADIEVTVVNPYSDEGANWLLGYDCQSEEAAVQIAKGCTSLKPENQRHDYFDEGAAQIIASIFIFLKENKGTKWGLTDVCEIARDEDQLREVLRSTDFGKGCLHYLGMESSDAPRSKGDMLGTVINTLNRMYIAAQKMKESDTAFSIREWLNRSGKVLVFSYPSNRAEIVSPIYGMLFQGIFEEVLSQPALEYEAQVQGKRQTYIFLDELLALPRLPGLPDFLNQGRKFGASVVLGLTSKAILNAKYSEEIADGMMNNCKNRFFGRCQGKDAQWSADMFFSVLTTREKVATSQSKSVSRSTEENRGRSKSTTWQEGLSRDYSYSKGKSRGKDFEPGWRNKQTSRNEGRSEDRTRSSGSSWSKSTTYTDNTGYSSGLQVGEEEGKTLDEHISEEQVVHPSEFMRYPDPLTGGAVYGVADSDYGACKIALNTKYIEEHGIQRIARIREWYEERPDYEA